MKYYYPFRSIAVLVVIVLAVMFCLSLLFSHFLYKDKKKMKEYEKEFKSSKNWPAILFAVFPFVFMALSFFVSCL